MDGGRHRVGSRAFSQLDCLHILGTEGAEDIFYRYSDGSEVCKEYCGMSPVRGFYQAERPMEIRPAGSARCGTRNVMAGNNICGRRDRPSVFMASKVVGMSRSCLTRTAIADGLDLQAQKGRKCTGFLSDDKEDLDVKSSQARNRDIIESGDRAEHMRERP